ncbi:hypothetical protein GCK32_016509, partial [Trichostrongylus colubriformis]
EHSVDVRIFDQSVQDSPFACNVGAPEKVAVRAVPRRILNKDLNTEHSFERPDQREFPVRIIPRGNARFTAEYRIEQVGEHHLTVWIAGRKVDGSPLSVAGYSADRVRLEPLGGGAVGHPVQFVVDAVDAGKGQLEISVNQGRVPNNVQMQGAGRCLVTFIPQHPGTYVIDVTFNGEQVHGCPIKVEILPKQVGETIHANLTPTAVSTAISAGMLFKRSSNGSSSDVSSSIIG